MNVRVFPPVPGASLTVNGRIYSTSTYLDVPSWDAHILTSNGWASIGSNGGGASGPTSQRPNPPCGSFFDTTLGETITWVAIPGTSTGRWVDPNGNTV